MNIFLIGMMGSGKSTIGKSLANALNYSFIDTDNEVEKMTKKSVSELFELEGENVFREREAKILTLIVKNKNQVVSTGGGFPCFNNLMQLINQNGLSIYLQADSAFLASRLKYNKTSRPLIKDLNDLELQNYLSNLLQKRAPYYLQAHHHISAKNLKVSDIISLIEKDLNKNI